DPSSHAPAIPQILPFWTTAELTGLPSPGYTLLVVQSAFALSFGFSPASRPSKELRPRDRIPRSQAQVGRLSQSGAFLAPLQWSQKERPTHANSIVVPRRRSSPLLH